MDNLDSKLNPKPQTLNPKQIQNSNALNPKLLFLSFEFLILSLFRV
jgi:hypothetical protein